MSDLVNLSAPDGARDDTFRRRLFPTAPSYCFGRKFTAGSGVCNANTVKGQFGCQHAKRCQALSEARTAAGVVNLAESFDIPADYDVDAEFPAVVPTEVIQPAKGSKLTTLSPAEQTAIEENILRIENSVISSTMESFLLLGREYEKAFASMTTPDFRAWLTKLGREYRMALRYVRWAQTVTKLGDSAKDKIAATPGITLEKFYVMIGAVGTDRVLELLDITAKDSHGADVPITRLPVREMRKALAAQNAEKKEAELPPISLDTPDCTSGPLVDDPDSEVSEPAEGAAEVITSTEPVVKGPFNALAALQPLLGVSRVWGVNRRDIELNLAKLDDKQAALLAEHLRFVEDVLVPDIRRVLELLKR